MKAVMPAHAVEEAANGHSSMAVAELARHVIAEAAAGAGACGAGERAAEGEHRDGHERQRPEADHLAYTEHHRAPISDAPAQRSSRKRRHARRTSNMRPTSGSAPAEDDRVGGEPAVVSTGDRSSPAHTDADVAKGTVEHPVPVDRRMQPAPDHLARGVLVAQVLGEPVRSLAPRVAALPDPTAEAWLALAAVPEAVLGQHRVVVVLGGPLESPVRLEHVTTALFALLVDQAGDRPADLRQWNAVRMGEGMATGGAGGGDSGRERQHEGGTAGHRGERKKRTPRPWRSPCRRGPDPGHPAEG